MAKRIAAVGLGIAMTIGLSACNTAPTPQAQASRNHEISCLTGSVGGALVGAAIGSLFGGGLGRDIIATAGAGVGANEGRRLACGG